MKCIAIYCLSMILYSIGYAQKHDFTWMLGYSGGRGSEIFGISILNFNPDTNLVITTDQTILYGFDVANITMSDSLGNFQFSSNGTAIFNNLSIPIENGNNLNSNELNGYILPQGVLSFPHPKGENYSFIHGRKGDAIPQMTEVFYSEINMTENDGRGKVTLRMQPIITGDTLLFGQLTAVKHGNGRDWWVLAQRNCEKAEGCLQNYFYKVLVTPNEVKTFKQGILRSPITETGAGQGVFTPDGTKYVSSQSVRDGIPHQVEIYDFDRCRGRLGSKQLIELERFPNTNDKGSGLAISANSRFAYLILFKRIIQLDLWASDIAASAVTVAEYDGFVQEFTNLELPLHFFKGQLAPDGKIYISATNSVQYLHVIHNPNEKGLACNVEQHGIELPTFNGFSIPNHPNYRLGKWEDSPCDTLKDMVSTTNVFEKADVKLYPNPAFDLLNIELETTTPYKTMEVQVYDLLGKQLGIFYDTYSLPLDYPTGLYLVKVLLDRKLVKTEKLIIQR